MFKKAVLVLATSFLSTAAFVSALPAMAHDDDDWRDGGWSQSRWHSDRGWHRGWRRHHGWNRGWNRGWYTGRYNPYGNRIVIRNGRRVFWY